MIYYALHLLLQIPNTHKNSQLLVVNSLLINCHSGLYITPCFTYQCIVHLTCLSVHQHRPVLSDECVCLFVI